MPRTYKKQFDSWNEEKKLIEIRSDFHKIYIHEREIWWCSIGVNIGVEMDGKNN